MERARSFWSRAELVIAAAVWLAVAALIHSRVGATGGQDFGPFYDAGAAVRAGRPIYSVPLFVYPPFAALVAVPFTYFGKNAGHLYTYIQVFVPVLAAAIAGGLLYRKNWILASGVLSLILLKSDMYVDALPTYNLSLLFVLPFVIIAIYWTRQRWLLGAVLLAISVSIKPLLLGLFAIPLLRRKWREVGIAIAVGIVLTALGAAFSHDLHGLLHLPGRIAGGTNLHGDQQVYNVSLASVGVVHPGLKWLMYLLRAVLIASSATVLWRSRAWKLDFDNACVIAGVAALAPAVCGGLSEIHYGILAFVPCAVLVVGRGGRVAQAIAIIGGLDLCLPLYNLHINVLIGSSHQVRWASAQTLVLIACIVGLARWPARRVAAEPAPATQPESAEAR